MNIDRYINMAEENFSGADGSIADQLDLNADGDYDFDGEYYADGSDDESGADGYYYADGSDDESGADGYYYAAGAPVAQPKQPSPYQVNCVNTTGGALTIVLFGKNQYLLTANFGSSVGTTVTPSQSNVTYLELLQQSADQPFETSLIRIQSANTSQITQILTITSKDANGQLAQIPVITQSYFSANQFQSGILDVPYPVKIDGNTNVSFSILANTSVTLTFFPAEKINTARTLGGGKSDRQIYGSPRVPMAVPMFTARPIGSGKKMVKRVLKSRPKLGLKPRH